MEDGHTRSGNLGRDGSVVDLGRLARTGRKVLPDALRRHLGRTRRNAIRALGGVVPGVDVPAPRPGLPLEEVLELVYPGVHHPRLPVLAREAVGGDRVHGMAQLRTLLCRVERQIAPSPVTVRLGVADVIRAEIGGLVLLADEADASVSGHIRHESGYEPHLTPVFERHCRPGATVGAEGRVLRGARRVIERRRPVVITELSCGMLSVISGCTADDYLGWFTGRGYRALLVDRSGGGLCPIEDPPAFLAAWGDPERIEDILLLPDG